MNNSEFGRGNNVKKILALNKGNINILKGAKVFE